MSASSTPPIGASSSSLVVEWKSDPTESKPSDNDPIGVGDGGDTDNGQISNDDCPVLHNYCADHDISVDDFKQLLSTLITATSSYDDVFLSACSNGFTAFHHLCNQPIATPSIITIAEIILKHSPSVAMIHDNIKESGKTPLHYAMNWARVRTDDTAIAYVMPILSLFIKYAPLSLTQVDTRGRTPLHALLAGDGRADHTHAYIAASPKAAIMKAQHLKTDGPNYTPFGNVIANCDESVMISYLTSLRRYGSSGDVDIVLADLTPSIAMDMARNSEWETVNLLVRQGATHIIPWLNFFLPPDCAPLTCNIQHGGRIATGYGATTANTRLTSGSWRWRILVHSVPSSSNTNSITNDPNKPTVIDNNNNDDNIDNSDEKGEGDEGDDKEGIDHDHNHVGGLLIGVANTRLVADAPGRGQTEGWLGQTWCIDQRANAFAADRKGCHPISTNIPVTSSSSSINNSDSIGIGSGGVIACYLDIDRRTFRVTRCCRTERQLGPTLIISPSCHYFPYFYLTPACKIELLDIERLS
jgi:hypothetical protein